MWKKTVLISISFLYLGCNQAPDPKTLSTAEDNSDSTVPLFERIDHSSSGLEFSNSLTHNVATRENLFDYDYFYNGAGVGLEDLNNDGLLDVFFCGNQVANKLYINQGEFKFTDVSQQAGIEKGNGWSTGVSFADINKDGWMDIYVSQGGPFPPEQRKNLLFINQQDGTFEEAAETYGLADTGIGTQSAFFDYDRDGDLDCIVMNENELYGVDPINLYRILKENKDLLYHNSSHLYRNDNGTFTDITKKAGIERPIFGLGLAVSDIDNDGWLDIYIASDYYIPDALFINDQKGGFTDRIKDFTGQISYYGMGLDIADINNDNLQDIFVLDMASSDHVRSKTLMASMSTGRFDYLVNKADFHYQYMYNSLQLNLGNNMYNNIAQLSETSNTDWSWAVLLSDFNLDQYKDILITNGYRRYALDNDLQRQVFEAQQKYRGRVPLDIKEQLYNQMPSEKLPNILYKNSGGLRFENVASSWGIGDLSFSNGAATGDLDNDGDLDIIVNNMDEEAFLYRNMAIEQKRGNFLKVNTEGSLSESFARVHIYYGHQQQMVETKRVRGYMSSVDTDAYFGLGKIEKIDSIRIHWPGGKSELRTRLAANQSLSFNEKDAEAYLVPENDIKTLFEAVSDSYGLDYVHQENRYDDFEKEILLPYKQSGQGPFITKGDLNGDGLNDLFIGGASGQAGVLFMNTGKDFKKKSSSALEYDNAYEDMEASFFDLEGDGDLDLYVVSGGNEYAQSSSLYADRIYENDGQGNLKRIDMDALAKHPQSGRSVTAIDFDQDNDQDLLVGNRIIPQNYPKYSPSVLYENREGVLIDVTSEKAPELKEFGIVNKIISTDFDNDGLTDFIAVGEWTAIGFFRNTGGRFERLKGSEGIPDDKGWWFDVKETDVNNDGLKDYVIGNVGLNIKFKSSKKKPFKVFSTDFDENGTNDIVLTKKYHDTYVPVRGRECSSQQMPFIKDKFPTYSEFANASLDEIYGEKLSTSYSSEATEFNSILLLNKGEGKFDKIVLPIEAQVFPVLDILAIDINGDKYDDLILSGNIYETEVETPRLDAISGLVLLSNQENNYDPLPYWQSGLYLTGNVKSADIVKTGNHLLMVHTVNDGAVGVHEIRTGAN